MLVIPSEVRDLTIEVQDTHVTNGDRSAREILRRTRNDGGVKHVGIAGAGAQR
jgi:hypothetical protein